MKQKSRGCKSPSKYASLKNLELALAQHNVSETGIEYEESELQSMIWEKQAKKDELEIERMLKEREEYYG